MEEKSGDIVHKSCKFNQQLILLWVEENKAVFVAILFLMLCFGIMDTVVFVINNTFLHVTTVGRNVWLDWLFIIITSLLGYGVWKSWIKVEKRIAPKTIALILVPTVLFVFFRFKKNSPYNFTSYWNGPISYLDGIALISFVIIGVFIYQQFNNSKERKTDDRYSFGTDVPIKGSDKDLFNMGSLVNRIVNYIAYTDVREAAFSMGLVGEWGDGKTSLMNLVEEKIQKEHSDFIVVRFNPRSSKKADFIQEDFLDSLKQSLAPLHSGIERTIDKYAEALDVIPGVPPIVLKGLELLHVRPDKEREIKRSDLKKVILEIDKRIVVLVDDLDRLTGEELIEVMKVLDTNGAFPNMVFLTSFDKYYVNTVLNNFLGLGVQTRAYTDKYFTVEIKVPLHPSFRLLDYLVKLLTDAVNSGFIKNDASIIATQTRKMSRYIMSRLYTIRDIKRFANQFLYDYAEVQRDVNFRDYFLLELIKYAHPEDYEAVYRLKYIHRGKTSFLSPSSEDLFYLNDTLISKKNKTGDGFDEPEIKPNSIDILRTLFPEESAYQNWYAGRYQKVYSSSSFEHYFYNYEYSHLRAEDIDRLFAEKSIEDVCKLIDGWGDFSKDLETYLLTRDVNSIKNKGVLRRFMQILLYSAHKHQSINYIGQNYCFLRKEDVLKIIQNCGFESMPEYIAWFKETMSELTAIEPMIPANYMRTPISATYSDQAEADLFVMTQQEMQEYALSLLKDYLGKIEENGWDAGKGYYMTQIQSDEKGSFMPEACKALHDAMLEHFRIFSPTLPFFAEDVNRVISGYTIMLRFKSVFVDKDEFEHFILSKDNDEVPEIEMIRAIWPIFKANGYSNFALPKDVSIEEAKKTMLKAAREDVKHYEEVNKKIDALAEEWRQGHSAENVQLFITKANDLQKELRSIPLELTISAEYAVAISKMIIEFQKFERTTK